MFQEFFKNTLRLWFEISPYLLLGIFIAGILNVFLGKEFIVKNLGRGGLSSIIKATILGIPLPVCSCGVIPLATSLEKNGAHKSSVLSFLVSTPTTGVDSILATYSLMGPLFAIFRPLGALISGVVVGLVNFLGGTRKEKTPLTPPHSHRKIKIQFKIKEIFRYGFCEVLQDIGRWLLLGTILGGFISAVIPENLFSEYLFFPWDFLIVMLLGIPLYVCATGSIPIAVSLISKGLSPGAGLVFLIVGPATNTVTLSFVRAKLGKKSFYIYLLSIVITAILLGLLFNLLWYLFSYKPALITGGGKMLPEILKIFSGIILFLLTINAVFLGRTGKIKFDFRIIVPDIHCQNCKITLESKLSSLEGIKKVIVDVENKSVNIKGELDRERIMEEIKKTGYTPL